MILKSIHLKNFQKHEDLFIELQERNVIQGQSDRGKSSILRAIYWVCFNRPSGTDFRREGTDTVEVTICTSKGDVITRGRAKKESYYILNGDKYTGIGTDVPEPVQRALPISSLNIARQHESMFLLSGSKPEASRYIFSLIGLEEMDKSLSVAESRRRKTSNEYARVFDEIEEKKKLLVKYKPVPEMKERLLVLEKMQKSVDRITEEQSALDIILRSLTNIDDKLIPMSVVDALISDISQVQGIQRQITDLQTCLDKYNSIHTTHTLEHVETAENLLLSLNQTQDSVTTLSKKISKMRAILTEMQGYQDLIQSAQPDLQELEAEWHRLMKDRCPICGRI